MYMPKREELMMRNLTVDTYYAGSQGEIKIPNSRNYFIEK